jgi:D-alanyl-D-alanine carboxypeptidase
MLKDCRAAGHGVLVVSTYRTHAQQTYLHNRMINRYLGYGYSKTAAKKKASTISAVPGTSEHQLGLAVDIIDTRSWQLDESQEDQPAQKWLMENSWKYGFILRYPPDTTEFTGIIYEPWHYRYVGKEIAAELHELGVTLEEYLRDLTED